MKNILWNGRGEFFDEEGLSTNLIPKYSISVKSLYQLEILLTQLKIEIPSILQDTEMQYKKQKDQEIKRLLRISEESEIVIVPNDKTNSFINTRKNTQIWQKNISDNKQNRKTEKK